MAVMCHNLFHCPFGHVSTTTSTNQSCYVVWFTSTFDTFPSIRLPGMRSFCNFCCCTTYCTCLCAAFLTRCFFRSFEGMCSLHSRCTSGTACLTQFFTFYRTCGFTRSFPCMFVAGNDFHFERLAFAIVRHFDCGCTWRFSCD